MAKKGKEIIEESFGDRTSVLVVGFLCLVYLGLFYVPGAGWVAKVLPLWPVKVFAGIGVVGFVFQLAVWKIYKHFYPKWYLQPVTLLLLICEFGLLFFSLLFCSWPVYLLLQLLAPKHSPF